PQPQSFGLHQVYPDAGEDDGDKDVDIIAIHGLDTQSPRQWVAWKQDGDANSGEVHWLKDAHMLPHKIPNARIFTYDWNANIDRGAAADGLLGFADGFLEELHMQKSENSKDRPIIFVASCFGGLLLIRALHRASESQSEYHHILQSTAGVVFLGTPFQGSDETFRTAAHFLGQDHKLDELVQVFRETVRKPQFSFPITCYYETLASDFRDLRKQLPPDLASILQQDSGILVNKHSAALPGERALPLNVRHSMICKYAEPENKAFRTLSFRLEEMVRNAGQVLSKKQVASGVQRGHLFVPFGKNEEFVGRDIILQQLAKRIPPSTRKNDCQWTAIEGLEGVGKTQIALEAAYRLHAQDHTCSVFWVPAVNMTTFENAYREIGRRLGVPGIEGDKADVKALVRDALSQDTAGVWLLIVDNLDDVDLLSPIAKYPLQRYFPRSGKGSILFTTRNHEVATKLDIPARDVLRVTEMSQAEAVEFLGKSLQEHQMRDTESMKKLTDFLACLPLAIKQASMYMFRTGASTTEYLEYCSSSDKDQIELLSEHFEDRGRYSETANPIATTWLISFSHIARNHALATRYLKFISFLAEEDIPMSILPPGESKRKQHEAIGVLSGYAFITRYSDAHSFDIHRLVRLATRNWLAHEWDARMRDVIHHMATVYPYPEYENRDVWMGYMPHAVVVLSAYQELAKEEADLKLIFNVAESFNKTVKYEEAEQIHRQTLKLRTEVLGPKNPDTLMSMNNLANVLESQGKYEEAAQIHRQTLELRIEVLGPKNRDTLISMNNLANVLENEGKYEEAEQIHRQTLELRTEVLGPKNPDTLKSMNNLAVVLKSQRKYEEVERIRLELVLRVGNSLKASR
ncbi:hypothetical protein JX266_013975, partial [Neoarthrinium moseri]